MAIKNGCYKLVCVAENDIGGVSQYWMLGERKG